MKRFREEAEGGSLSFLDVIACAFGAIILLVLVLPVGDFGLEEQPSSAAQYGRLLFALGGLEEEGAALARQLAENGELAKRLDADLAQAENAGRYLETLIADTREQSRRARQRAAAIAESSRILRERPPEPQEAMDVESELAGIPVDSEHVAFVVDTSGSMQMIWEDVMEEVANVLSLYPRLRGFQILNDQGDYLYPAKRRRWIPDSPDNRRDLSCLRYQFVAGERLDPPTYHWLRKHLGIPVIDHWWQTETGWPICANLMGLEPREGRPGSSGRPVPGYDLRILGEDGRELPPGEEGALVLKEPLPPGAFPSLWQDHERFLEAYWSKFPGHYLTGDNGFQDEDGWVCIMGRADDLINVAGHRLSTGALEEAVAGHPAVAECAVVGMADADRGQVPLGLVVLKDGLNLPAEALQAELAQRVRRAVGAFANFKRVLQVKRLPKTRSGKILRQALRKAVDGEPCAIPSTIDDPAIMEEIQAVLEAERVGRAAPGTESAG